VTSNLTTFFNVKYL